MLGSDLLIKTIETTPPPDIDILKRMICNIQFRVSIGYSMFCFGYGIYTRERSSRVYIS